MPTRVVQGREAMWEHIRLHVEPGYRFRKAVILLALMLELGFEQTYICSDPNCLFFGKVTTDE